MIQYLIKNPDIRLAPYIKGYFWGKDNDAPKVQRIVPNGEMGLCIYKNCKVVYDRFGETTGCISGQRSNYTDIISNGFIENIAVNFTTLGASVFFDTPLQEYHDKYVPIEEITDKGYIKLSERINEESDPEKCFEILDEFFLEKISHNTKDELNIRRMTRALSYGQINREARICDFASEVCISERQFTRIFNEIVGMSPKNYFRLKRYHQTVIDLKNRKHNQSLSEIAIENGYADFSHMSSEFKRISGYSPADLLKISENDTDEIGWRI